MLLRILLLLSFTVPVMGQDCSVVKLPSIGKLYDIEEVDLYLYIQNKLKQINWSELNKKMKKKIFAYKPVGSKVLEYAKEHRIRFKDPSWTLPVDVVDAEGNLLFKKGTVINVLERVPEEVWKRRVYVFFDLKDKCQKEFVKEFLRKHRDKLIFLIADGHSNLKDITDFIKKLHFPVYSLTDVVAKRFGVDKSISVVSFVKKNGKPVVRIEEIPPESIKLEVCREKGN